MILSDPMKNALAEGLSADPGVAGAAAVAGFLAGLPSGLGVTDLHHWSGALVVIRHLCFSREHSAAAMRVLDVARGRDFGAAVAAAGGPAASAWPSVLDRVRAIRLDRADVVIVHRAYIATAPGYREQAVTTADLDAVTEPLLIGDEDRLTLISHGDDAIEPAQPLRVDAAPVADGDVEPSQRENGVWRAFDALAAADPAITCLADLLRPGYPEQRPGRIGGDPVTPAMLEEATKSLGTRYRSASPQSDAAHKLLTRLHGACREWSVAELVTRHTRHLIASGGDAASMRSRLRASGGEYDDVVAAAPVRGPLSLPGNLGHSGELDVAAERVVVVDGGDVAEKVAVRTLGTVCGLVTLLLLLGGFSGFVGGLIATGYAVVSFLWADKARHYAGATFGLVVFTMFWTGTGGFFDGLGIVAVVALLVGSLAKFLVGVRGSGGKADAAEAAAA